MGYLPEARLPFLARLAWSEPLIFAPAPMPRLVGDALAVFRRVRKMKAERFRIPAQPAKLPGAGKRNLQAEMIRRTQVERASRVVFAATRNSAYPQDVRDPLAARQLAADDGGLSRHAAEGGKREKDDAIGGGGSLHFPPGPRRGRRELQNTAVVLGLADEHQPLCFRVNASGGTLGVVGGNAESLPQSEEETRVQSKAAHSNAKIGQRGEAPARGTDITGRSCDNRVCWPRPHRAARTNPPAAQAKRCPTGRA